MEILLAVVAVAAIVVFVKRASRSRVRSDAVRSAVEDPGATLGRGGPLPATSEHDDGDLPELVLQDDRGWFTAVTADPRSKTLVFYGHTDDYHSVFHSTEEYRFDGNNVLTRLLEDYVEHPEETVRHVKDGVVLESEMRKRAEAGATLLDVEDELAEYKARLEWKPVLHRRLRFWVMSQHPHEFPSRDLRRIIRAELECVEGAARKLLEEAKANGLDVRESERGFELAFPQSFTDADKQRVRAQVLSEERLASLGTRPGELGCLKEVRKELLELLGESAPA